ncbi:MAG: MurR/RpiR family transcriptional regulator [Synergistaceae bacterium]|nr:MurR/RpiR family transcriptional regulator [Synergistaceae bacterium]
MDSNELQKLMREKLETVPNKARRVIEYLLTNTREAAFRSIGEVADQLEVSKAQMVRVARILGFTGYAELKDALQGAILEQVNPAAMLAKATVIQEDLPESIHRMEHANLDETWNQLKPDLVTQFCGLVQDAKCVYCLGWGISSLVAESCMMRLRVLGIPSMLMQRSGLALLEQARAVGEKDAVIVCELPSYAVEVTETVERCAAQGATIVTITDSLAAPVCRYATLSLFASAASPTFGSSVLGPLFLIHVLTSVLAVSMGSRAKAALEEQAAFLHDSRYFHPAFGLRYS